MATNAEFQTEEMLAQMKEIFAPGNLSKKHTQIISLRKSGDTMLFEGAVHWQILISEFDQILNGSSETLDDAFADMASCLGSLSQKHEENTQVVCSISFLEQG